MSGRQSLPALPAGAGYDGQLNQRTGLPLSQSAHVLGSSNRAFSPPPIPAQPGQAAIAPSPPSSAGGMRQSVSNMFSHPAFAGYGHPGRAASGASGGGASSSSSSGENIPAASGSSSSNENTLYGSSSAQHGLMASQRNSSYMSPASNTVGLDTTSAAIARGEIGANYSRYSTGNLAGMASPGGLQTPPMASNSRFSMNSPSRTPGDEREIELDSLPHAGYYANGGIANSPVGSNMPSRYTQSRFSEYGLADNASAESPSFRDSTLYDHSGQRESMQFYNTNKSMEDTSLLWNEKNIEADDFLHDPRTLQTGRSDRFWNFPTSARGIANAIGISVLLGGILALFMGWPVATYIKQQSGSTMWGWGLGATNSSGQVPDIAGFPSLIDTDTPNAIKNGIRTGFDGQPYELVFSDEFNANGRSFYPGDDPYWEAVDLHYWQTRDMEWYHPSSATTRGGNLVITMTEQPINGLSFQSAMLQSWNKLCFNGGFYVEMNVSLPGNPRASGYWPGAWTMGNLGRAGFGATNDGMWPYSYDSCDVGTLAGQLFANNTPVAAYNGSGTPDYQGKLSILSGQRASACSCKGDPHPGPNNKKGRGAPEIDILEAQIDWRGYGTASQSIQIAPFDDRWYWDNSSTGMRIWDTSVTVQNDWTGAATQEAASAVTRMPDPQPYGGVYQTFGFELIPGSSSDSSITWSINGSPTWQLKAAALRPNAATGVGQRLMSEEPMYLIMNLALSNAFQSLQFDRLEFPGSFLIDYVRVYQRQGQVDVSCDPKDHPTTDYINEYMEYYTNPNITTWPKNLVPRNRLNNTCT